MWDGLELPLWKKTSDTEKLLLTFFITFVEGCFPAHAEVKVENGKSLKMYELQIGDKVQTGKQILISNRCYLE